MQLVCRKIIPYADEILQFLCSMESFTLEIHTEKKINSTFQNVERNVETILNSS